MKTKVVIFGATGSIGIYTSVILKEQGYDVVAVGRRKSDNGFFSKYDIPYYSVEICNKNNFKDLPNDVDAVVHLAGAMPAHMKEYAPQQYIDSIVSGTMNVLDYMLNVGCKKIIFSQSIADVLYKFGTKIPIKDDVERKFPLNTDHSIYSICKNAAVNIIEHYYSKYGIQYFILRLPTIYCYHANPYYYVDGIQKWLGYRFIIEQAIKGETLEIWGDPNSAKEMVYIKDLIQLIQLCIENNNKHGIYNVGCGKPISIEDQIKKIAEVFNDRKKSDIIYCPDKKSSPQFVLSIEKAKTELNYCPIFGFEELLHDYKYYLEEEPFYLLMGKRTDFIN